MTRMGAIQFALLVAVLVFLADKIALVPAFRECCTNAPAVRVYKLSLDSDFRQKKLIEAAKAQGRPYFMNFGSSRSLGFYSSPSRQQIKEARQITDSERVELDRWEIINHAAPGATLVTEYVRLMQWLDEGARPDFVAMEFSPFSVNGQSLWLNEELKNGVPWDFALRYSAEMPRAHVSTILGSRLFALARYRVGTPTAMSISIWESMFDSATADIDKERTGIAANVGVPVGSEAPAVIMMYKHMTSEMRRTMFSSYRVDPDMALYAHRIAARLKREKIPVLFWNPSAHPVWLEGERGTDSRGEFTRLVRELESEGAVYVDMNEPGRMKCAEFMDPVHLHTNCFAELAARQIGAVKPRL